MLDPVLVERVFRDVRRRCLQVQARPRHEPEQIAALAADRAIAFGDLADLAVDVELDPSAMTAALVGHVAISGSGNGEYARESAFGKHTSGADHFPSIRVEWIAAIFQPSARRTY